MFLSRFGVKNYKCLVDIDIPLTPIHVLIGQNDAGKTSLLEALEAFYQSPNIPLDGVFSSQKNLLFHGADKPRIELSGAWSRIGEKGHPSCECEYGFSVDFVKHQPWIFDERITSDDGQSDPFKPRPRFTSVYKNLSPEDIGHNWKHCEKIRPLLGGIQKYAFDAKSMRTPAALVTKRKFRLDSDGFGLPTLLADLAEYDTQLIESVRKTFLSTFEQFTSVRTETANGYIREYTPNGLASTSGSGVGKALYFDTASGGTLTGEQVSDGVILVLGFLALAHTPNPPKLLLIEEPENGIYPQRLQEVIGLLKEMIQRSDDVPFPQIIMSTHSPYVLSMFEPEEVTFLSRRSDDPAAGVRARPMRDAPHIRERMAGGEFYLGELWYNLDEEELFSEP